MDVQTTTAPGVITFQPLSKEEITEISVPEPLTYTNLAMIQKMVVTS
jgi:hypothetical protein